AFPEQRNPAEPTQPKRPRSPESLSGADPRFYRARDGQLQPDPADAYQPAQGHGFDRLVPEQQAPDPLARPDLQLCRSERFPRQHRPRPANHRPAEKRDRKSTRLNSSHVSISYAVFCLKKKKT